MSRDKIMHGAGEQRTDLTRALQANGPLFFWQCSFGALGGSAGLLGHSLTSADAVSAHVASIA